MFEVLDHLREAGLNVRDIVVAIDRGQGGSQVMARHGLRCHAVATMEEVLQVLLAGGRIDASQVGESLRFMRDSQEDLRLE
jgi:uridine monophosphate synthetase